MSTCVAELRTILQRWPQGLTAKQLSEILAIGRQTASNRLSRMAAYGHAEKLHIMGQHAPIYRIVKERAA